MKRTRVVLWVMVALVSSLLILSGGMGDNGSRAQAASIEPYAGLYGGYTQSEKGATGLNYSAVHTRSITRLGLTSGETYAEVYNPEYGVQVTTCTSTGTATLLGDNFLQITAKQTCTGSEYELNVTSICTGTGLTPNGYTELFCIDTTVELPGYEAINTTILKRK